MAIEVIKPRALPLLLLSFFNTRPTPTHTLFPKLNRLYKRKPSICLAAETHLAIAAGRARARRDLALAENVRRR
jgi:hypothetical protein